MEAQRAGSGNLVQIASPSLTGIARLAAAGGILAEKRKVEYRSLPTRNWLNRCNSQRVPFQWTINPYRGCEYGCKYCYARFTHEFLERRGRDDFETEIYAKEWDRRAFLAELRTLNPGDVIAIGTATDPYQPAERKFGLTQQVLDAMLLVRGMRICLTTKSNLVARDVVLLKNLSTYNDVSVAMTVTTMDRKLARLLEPNAPRPDLRMKAVAKLAQADVHVGVLASPVIPLLTDSEKNLEAVARAAQQAGATRFGAGVLFLKPAAQRVFFPFLSEKFPQHLERYRANYAAGAYLKGLYPDRIGALVESIRRRVGILSRDLEAMRPPTPPEAQFSLF
ncbi:MAG TPA: radical SAM protein [Bryobacteraceae bacterium]|nr:radical SAM protein [Bryobacteraceae bacterium]